LGCLRFVPVGGAGSVLPALPRTSNGKFDYPALKAAAAPLASASLTART
jgi:hypothetical protein